MPEQNEQKQPKAPAFNPKVKATIAAFKEENSPKNLNDILNELVRSPLLAPAVFDLQGQPAPKPGPDGRVQLPKNTKISLVMVNSPEEKHYYWASAIGTPCTSGRPSSPAPRSKSSCCALTTMPI